MSKTKNDKTVSVSQAAAIIGCTKNGVYSMLNRGSVQGAEKVEEAGMQVWRLPLAEVERIRDNPSPVGHPRTRARKTTPRS